MSALLAGTSYRGALMERLNVGRAALRTHPVRERLQALLADVEQVYAGPTDHSGFPVQRHDEHEELREQYAPLFWHYLGRALRAADEVEFVLMETRIRCLMQEFRAEMGTPIERAVAGRSPRCGGAAGPAGGPPYE